MSHHLGYAAGQAKPEGASANHRNGKGTKTVLTDVGALRIDVPQDREVSAPASHVARPLTATQEKRLEIKPLLSRRGSRESRFVTLHNRRKLQLTLVVP